MIDFVTRAFVFEKCPQLAYQLMTYQQAMFNPLEDLFCEGDKVFLESGDESPTTLSKEQADQLNAETAADCKAIRDDFAAFPMKSDFYEGVIAELDVPSFDLFIKQIDQSLSLLWAALGWGEIFIISDRKRSYLTQENDYAPVQNATQNLLRMGLTRTSTQGVVLSKNVNANFFASIFWIVRCNMSASNIWFSSPNSNIFGVLCKRGNIHFECFDPAERDLLMNALTEANFIQAPNGICDERFSNSRGSYRESSVYC